MVSLATVPRRTRLNILGAVVLLIGLGIGGFIYWHSLQGDSDDDVLAAQDQSKAYDQAVQRNIGATGLLMDRWTQNLSGLARPRPLAVALIVVSGVTAGGLFVAASRAKD